MSGEKGGAMCAALCFLVKVYALAWVTVLAIAVIDTL